MLDLSIPVRFDMDDSKIHCNIHLCTIVSKINDTPKGVRLQVFFLIMRLLEGILTPIL